MEEGPTLQITLVSGACCSPALGQLDKELDQNVQQAIDRAGAKVEVSRVSLSHVLHDAHSLNAQQRRQVLALFQKYGARLAPAVLIGERVRFAGSVPSVEQLSEALTAAIDTSS